MKRRSTPGSSAYSGSGYSGNSAHSTSSAKRREVTFEGQKTVPLAQYEELWAKYEELLKEREKSGKSESHQEKATENSDEDVPMAVKEDTLEEKTQETKLTETVQLNTEDFAQKRSPSDFFTADGMNDIADRQVLEEGKLDDPMEGAIIEFRRALKLFQEKRFELAMDSLQKLEAQNFPQIKVRAKFFIAEILFAQKEYDLALQVYEEIVKNNAFTGFVLPSLKRLIVCTEQLKLTEKKQRYFSIYHDLFGEG